MKSLISALICCGAAASFVYAVDYTAEGNRWWAHIEHLANDEMQGRDVGSPGYSKAADYVSGEFKKYGLKPAGTNGYFQPVKFEVKQIDEPHSSIALVRDGKTEPLELGQDANFGLRGDPQEGEIEAGAVFVGYGLTIPEKNYDDLKGLDLKGKFVVTLAGGPKDISGALRSHYGGIGERWKFLQKAGVIGTISIANPKSMDVPWARQSLSRFQPSMRLADTSLQDALGMRVAFSFNPERADKLLAGTGHTMAELLADADNQKPLPHFPLAVKVKTKLAFHKSTVEAPNVVGMLPGNDPKLKNEYVVLSAHLDHVGVGQPINGDKIYNGAMDDASGIASILETARMLQESQTKLKRSLLFVAVTAEEKGLLGSRYFAAHPTVKKSDIVADVNFDMFLPIHPLHIIEVQGLEESTLGEDIKAVGQAEGLKIEGDQEPDRNLFVRSDQYSFIRQGVPALSFKFGFVRGSAEAKMHKDWLTNRYHAPSDDLNQPVDKAAAAQFDDVILKFTVKVANEDSRPHWNSGSFFSRFATGS